MTSSSSSFSIVPEAYATVLLHASQYAQCETIGVLLASPSSPNVVTHAIPLFHTPVLSPMASVALAQLTEYCATSSLAIVGLYAANSRVRDIAALPLAASSLVAQFVPSTAPARIILLVDDSKFSGSDFALLRCAEKGDEWRPLSTPAANSSDVAACSKLWHGSIEANVIVADFDAHLEDVAKDWRNVGIFRTVDSK